jgi:hypothetical protein
MTRPYGPLEIQDEDQREAVAVALDNLHFALGLKSFVDSEAGAHEAAYYSLRKLLLGPEDDKA